MDKRRTFIRWMAAFLVVAFPTLIIGSTWFYRSQQQALRNNAEAQLASIGKLKANQITAWRVERIGDAAVLMESPFLAQGVARFLANPHDKNIEQLLARFHSLQVHKHYTNILLVDPKGEVFLNLTGKAEDHEAYSAALIAALRERKPILTELYVGEQILAPCLSVVAPIFAGTTSNAPPLGAIILVSDASQFLYPLIQSWPTPSESAETLLIRRDGRDALFLNDLRHRPNAALKLRMPLNHTDLPAVMAIRGQQGIFHGKDYRGVEVLAFILQIPDSSWFMVAKQDTREIFSRWYFHALMILGLFMSIAAGLAAMGLITWQQKVHYQKLYAIEIRLREIEMRYRNIFDNLLEGCQIIGFDWRFLYLNDTAAKQRRHTKEQMLGRTIMEVFPGIEKNEFFELLNHCMQAREVIRTENEFVYSDGTKGWFDLFIQPVPEGIFILSTDTSERKRMEAERLEFERRDQQIAKIESLSRMAGAVAHHFNNLLAAVLGNLELAMEDLQSQEDTMQLLVAAEEQARRSVALSKKMLVSLGQLPEGKHELLDLSRICKEHLATLHQEIPEGVTLKTDLLQSGPVIKTDQNQIKRILSHLVTNAVEAIKTFPGVVLVLVEETNGAEIPKKNRRPMTWEPSAATYACLSVTDSGCGMTAKTINQIFDPFFTDKFTGRGLGLPMVLGIVKSFGGCITVTSMPEQGSTIKVYFPLLKGEIYHDKVSEAHSELVHIF
jgi:PAS domain S-box-containing protein